MDIIFRALVLEYILLVGLGLTTSSDFGNSHRVSTEGEPRRFARSNISLHQILWLIYYGDTSSRTSSAMKASSRSRAISTPPQGKLECVDDMKYCAYFKSQGFCTHSSYMDFMQKHCKETCGFCQKPKPTSIPVVQNCNDRSMFCNVWKQYCARQTPYIKRNCQKTCNFCKTEEKQKPKNEIYTGPCGVPAVRVKDSKKHIRIVGGEDAEYGAVPWQASLFYYGNFKCGAVLFHDQHVLTAAHCFKTIRNLDPVSFTVYLGKHYKFPDQQDEGQIKLDIVNILIHPDYNKINDDNDIAIIQLKRKVRFTRYVRPICLPKQGDVLIKGTPALVSGWGDTKGGNSNEILQYVDVYIQANDECNMGMSQFTNKIDEVNENMVCAGHTRGTKDSCNGDSGGPLVIKSTNGSLSLAGLVSWGYGCGHAYRPGVYTRLPNYVNWINSNLYNTKNYQAQHTDWEREEKSAKTEKSEIPSEDDDFMLVTLLEMESNEDFLPQESFPEESFPEESFPEESFPEESFPEESFPEEALPGEPLPITSTTPDWFTYSTTESMEDSGVIETYDSYDRSRNIAPLNLFEST